MRDVPEKIGETPQYASVYYSRETGQTSKASQKPNTPFFSQPSWTSRQHCKNTFPIWGSKPMHRICRSCQIKLIPFIIKENVSLWSDKEVEISVLLGRGGGRQDHHLWTKTIIFIKHRPTWNLQNIRTEEIPSASNSHRLFHKHRLPLLVHHKKNAPHRPCFLFEGEVSMVLSNCWHWKSLFLL